MSEYYAPSDEHPWLVSHGGAEGATRGLTSVEAVLNAVDTLDTALRAGSQEGPWLAMVGHEGLLTYLSMGIGIGADPVLASFQAEPDENYASIAAEGSSYTEEDTQEFLCGGEWMETYPTELIPYATARSALESFVRTGERPATIAWERL